MRWLLVSVAVAVAVVASPVGAGAVRVRNDGMVRWGVQYSILWNEGSSGRSFGLDQGRTEGGHDLDLIVDCPQDCRWHVLSTAGGGTWLQPDEPSLGECQDGWASVDREDNYRRWIVPTDGLTGGSTWGTLDGGWLCFRTVGGRFAKVQIAHWPTRAQRFFSFRYTTWEK